MSKGEIALYANHISMLAQRFYHGVKGRPFGAAAFGYRRKTSP